MVRAGSGRVMCRAHWCWAWGQWSQPRTASSAARAGWQFLCDQKVLSALMALSLLKLFLLLSSDRPWCQWQCEYERRQETSPKTCRFFLLMLPSCRSQEPIPWGGSSTVLSARCCSLMQRSQLPDSPSEAKLVYRLFVVE